MAGRIVGIDLGTTNSVVAVSTGETVRALADADGGKLIPSVVAFHPSGQVLVGKRARERRAIDARNTVYSVKRLIGRPFDSDEVRAARERFPFEIASSPTGGVVVVTRGERHTLPEISAFVLREVRRVAEDALDTVVDRAVVTVPANFNELQRTATKAAGKIAGIEVVRTINEPTAAALAYGTERARRERIAVFDLGGGTFDVTVLELADSVFEVLGTAGDTYLGGDDVDRAIAEMFSERFLAQHRYDPRSDPQTFERMREAAEAAKCALSYQEFVDVAVEEVAHGRGGASLDLRVRLDRPQFEQIAEPIVARAFRVCEAAMRSANVTTAQLDNVILVGGSTRMPLVRRMVASYFAREPLHDIDPDLVVAEGAAIQARALEATLGRGMVTVPDGMPISQAAPVGAFRAPGVPPPVMPRPPAITHAAPPSDFPMPMPGKGPVRTLPDFVPPQLPMRGSLPELDIPFESAPQPIGAWNPVAPPPVSRDAPDMPPAPPLPALLVDVTPLTLGVETVGGFCEPVIPKNAPIPLEESRVFSTAQDDQETVRVRVCQGESRRMADNQLLGELELSGIRRAARGKPRIRVTFIIDVDGSLAVEATDVDTGQQQRTQIRLVGAMDEAGMDDLKHKQDARMRGANVRR